MGLELRHKDDDVDGDGYVGGEDDHNHNRNHHRWWSIMHHHDCHQIRPHTHGIRPSPQDVLASQILEKPNYGSTFLSNLCPFFIDSRWFKYLGDLLGQSVLFTTFHFQLILFRDLLRSIFSRCFGKSNILWEHCSNVQCHFLNFIKSTLICFWPCWFCFLFSMSSGYIWNCIFRRWMLRFAKGWVVPNLTSKCLLGRRWIGNTSWTVPRQKLNRKNYFQNNLSELFSWIIAFQI